MIGDFCPLINVEQVNVTPYIIYKNELFNAHQSYINQDICNDFQFMEFMNKLKKKN